VKLQARSRRYDSCLKWSWLKECFFQIYKTFHRFGQAKFSDGGWVLGSSQFSTLTRLPPKIMIDSKEVKIDRKVLILLCLSKSVTHYEEQGSQTRSLRAACGPPRVSMRPAALSKNVNDEDFYWNIGVFMLFWQKCS